MVYKLKRSPYGLAESPVLRNDTINAVTLTVGSTPTQFNNPCVYTYGSDDTFTILTLYVDGILIGGANENVVKQLKKAVKDRFAITGMGEVSLIIKMALTRDYEKGALPITQEDYTSNILERFGMEGCNPVHTPDYRAELSSQQPEEILLGATERCSTKPSWVRYST